MKSKEEFNSDMENTVNPGSDADEQALPDATIEETDPLSKLEAELTESRDKYLRLYSEFENFKRRVSRDRIEQSKMAGSEIFLSILPVIDDLERALKSVDTKANPELEGFRLIFSKLKSNTESRGLKAMDATGKTFDPELHDAIANVPAPSEDMKGKVLEEVEKGYYLNDKVIRHAKVVVGI
jgi:molecular chaperone GrpE